MMKRGSRHRRKGVATLEAAWLEHATPSPKEREECRQVFPDVLPKAVEDCNGLSGGEKAGAGRERKGVSRCSSKTGRCSDPVDMAGENETVWSTRNEKRSVS